MDLVFTQGPSGLVVANQGSDEAACARALREHDPDLRLVPPGVLVQGERESRSDAWRVYRYCGSERPIEFVCGWWDDRGTPYPQLSADGLLRMVQSLDRNLRGDRVEADEHNARLLAERAREAHERFTEIAREFDGRLEGKRSAPQPRSRNLYLARSRERERIRSRELRP